MCLVVLTPNLIIDLVQHPESLVLGLQDLFEDSRGLAHILPRYAHMMDLRVCTIMILELHIHAYGSSSVSSHPCLPGFGAGVGVALGAGLWFSAAAAGVLVRASCTGSLEEAPLSQKPGIGADPSSSIIRPGKSPPISVTSIFLIVVSADDRRSLPEVLMSVQYSRISGSYLSFLGTNPKPSHKSQHTTQHDETSCTPAKELT